MDMAEGGVFSSHAFVWACEDDDRRGVHDSLDCFPRHLPHTLDVRPRMNHRGHSATDNGTYLTSKRVMTSSRTRLSFTQPSDH
jgi:hypothetical protein